MISPGWSARDGAALDERIGRLGVYIHERCSDNDAAIAREQNEGERLGRFLDTIAMAPTVTLGPVRVSGP